MTYTLMPGQSHEISDEDMMSVIRSVLTEDVPSDPAPKRSAKTIHRAFTPRRRTDDLPEIAQQEEERPAKPRRPVLRMDALARTVARIRAFRPSTRHLAIVSTLLLVVVRPHWFVIAAVLIVTLVVGVFLLIGSDRIWRGIVARLARIEVANPERAARLRTRLDRFACRWDAILDMFPDGMVDSLYMPDLQEAEDAEAQHADAVAARMRRMAEES
ncbi:hypothetical protein [uncultured Tateyamaria sp.]|uniref:hypothetical protein n=1 Tax=uncultured Tateyamaria sp. TaxID=455651 RepID=UPI0026323D42|nr:hypothetical protein [uncultured Tateyamaria sp.]